MPALDPRTQLGVQLSAICSRHRFDPDPTNAITELRTAARQHTDLLAEECGIWAGFYREPHTRVLADALVEHIEGAAAWVDVGQRRRGTVHSGSGFTRTG